MNHGTNPVQERWQPRFLLVGIGGLLLCAAAGFWEPSIFFRCYLTAYLFWLGISLGSLVIVMLHNLTGGGWGWALRPLLMAAIGNLPLLALLFLPILFGLSELYAWTHEAEVAADPILQHKSYYLNEPFFMGRVAGYFLVWLFLAFFLRRWARQENGVEDSPAARRLRTLSGPGLVLYGLTITFASIDWLMSLHPHWFSSIYPVVIGVGQVLAGFAFSITMLGLLTVDREKHEVKPDTFQNLGNMLMAFVMLWAYVSFSQYLLIWSGNLPEEVEWYLPRLQGGWQVVALVLLLGQFAVPFLLLLSRRVKRHPRELAKVAGFLLVMRFVDSMWQVLPGFPVTGSWGHALDVVFALVALLGMGGVWMAMLVRQLQKQSVNIAPPEEATHG